MLNDIIVPSEIWPLSELKTMQADGDLVGWGEAFICWDFIETPETRLRLLRATYRARGVPVGEAAVWVESGGKLPSEIVLQEPRRRPYCCTR